MAETVVMPQLGNTVESCIVLCWHVSVGDEVGASTILCEVETDKSVMEVPVGVAGTVLALYAAEGDEVAVKAPIAAIGQAGEEAPEAPLAGVPAVSGEAGEVDETVPDDQAPEVEPSVPESDGRDQEAESGAAAEPGDKAGRGVSPRARARAERDGVALDALAEGTGPGGRVIERDVIAAAAAGPRPTAATRGGDPTGVGGTGLGGRGTSADLATGAPLESPPPAKTTEREFPGEFSDTPLTGVRKIIAERMTHALASSAQLTYTSTANAEAMLALRTRFKNSDPALGFTGVTLGDLVCYATVRVLAQHATLNAHLTDGVLRTFASVHLGLAVDTPRGLLVPTIRNADAMSLVELSNRTKELAEAARSGKIDPELLTGATFTVSNLGAFGIESFTPIINVPQTGILGVNTIVPRAVANAGGSVGVEQRMGFSLTADHQVVDGADAGRFLADLGRAIENIDLTVMSRG